MLDGYKWRRTQQIDDSITQSWLTAKLVWASPFPKLEELLCESNKESVQQTPEDMEAVVRVLNAAYGGKVRKRG